MADNTGPSQGQSTAKKQPNRASTSTSKNRSHAKKQTKQPGAIMKNSAGVGADWREDYVGFEKTVSRFINTRPAADLAVQSALRIPAIYAYFEQKRAQEDAMIERQRTTGQQTAAKRPHRPTTAKKQAAREQGQSQPQPQGEQKEQKEQKVKKAGA